MMVDSTAIGADISRLVQSSPQGRILGSELAVLLKRGHPDFRPESFGCRNLRDFIRKYAREVFETTRQGTDVVYSSVVMPAMSAEATRKQEFRTISSPRPPVRRLTIPTSVWKTFTSPNGFYRVFANRESGDFRVLRTQEDSLGVPWVQIQPCPPAVHLQIAKEFTENLSNETTKAELGKVLGLDSWWTHFFVAARRFNVESLWSSFRRRRLHTEFEQQLKTLGVPLPFAVSPTPTSTPTPTSVPTPTPADNATEPPPLQTEEGSDLRRIAFGVIRRLPASRLRELWLPLGYVLDEIGEK
jgi:hypothetical protein